MLSALAHGALLGARGNSGVILSQLLRGLADGLAATPAGPDDVAGALAGRGGRLPTHAVAEPVEGTMLTVARAAADGRGAAGQRRRRPGRAWSAAAPTGAREALARTPDQLEVLRRAGRRRRRAAAACACCSTPCSAVVTGDVPRRGREGRRPAGGAGRAAAGRSDRAAGPGPRGRAAGPAYEVMYLLDAPAEAIPPLRATLAPLGDSLVVVGAEPTWNVHVHVDDAGAAIEAGIEAGRPHRIRSTHFRDAGR